MNILEKGILLFIFKNSSNCLRDFAYDTVGPVFGVCGRERLIPVCLATGIGLNIEIFHLACWHKMGLSVRKPFFGGGGGGGGGGCEHQWRRSAQTDQRLFCSLCNNYDLLTCYERGFGIQVSVAGETGLGLALSEAPNTGLGSTKTTCFPECEQQGR